MVLSLPQGGAELPRPARARQLPVPHELHERRQQFLLALRELDDAWVSTFHKTGLGDVYFSRLFTELWLRNEAPVPMTEAYSLVQGVSTQTAMKYLRKAISEGYLEELPS